MTEARRSPGSARFSERFGSPACPTRAGDRPRGEKSPASPGRSVSDLGVQSQPHDRPQTAPRNGPRRGGRPALFVFVVEDNTDDRELYASYLTSHGLRVETASDGASGLTRISHARPDLV